MSDLQRGISTRSAPRKNTRKGRRGATEKSQNSKDWTIKGLPADTVDVARDAAKESGMKINAWVAQVFEKAASSPIPEPRSVLGGSEGKHPNVESEIAWLRTRNEELHETVRNLSAALAKMCS